MRFGFFGTAVMAASFAASTIAGTSTSQARVQVTVDLTTQQMHVTSSTGNYTWKISSGRGRYHTPLGNYRPTVMRRMHYSRKYNNSPMPYSIFFRGGYAIHGTNYVSQLGRPASHGCVRLATANAATLYQMVRREGARIKIVGSRAKFYAKYYAERRKLAAERRAKRKLARAKRLELRRAKWAEAKRKKLLRKKLYRVKLAALKKQKKHKRKIYTKRSKSKKYYAKRYKKKRYAKNDRSNRRAASRNRSVPLAYAPLRRTRSTFDFFRNPNNI